MTSNERTPKPLSKLAQSSNRDSTQLDNQDSSSLDALKRDIVAELTNAYCETYRYERPNDNVGQLAAFCRDLAEDDINELLEAYVSNQRREAEQRALEWCKRECFPDRLADASGIYALQVINDRLEKLREEK